MERRGLRPFKLALILVCTTNICAKCPCAKFEQPSLANASGDPQHSYMNFVERVLQSQCDLVDPLHCRRYALTDCNLLNVVDFIVVGAGTAGCVVASRLSEVKHWSVLLLEAGGPEPTAAQVPAMYHMYKGTDIDWNFPLEVQNSFCRNEQGFWQRGKVMGGTGVMHGMMYMRGNPWDFDEWENEGNRGWSYNDVLPYFIKSEDNLDVKRGNGVAEHMYHGVGGPLIVQRFPHQPEFVHTVLAAAKEAGSAINSDLNGHSQMGFGIAQANTVNGRRISLNKAFIQNNLYRKNLHISTDSLVTKILIDPKSKRAYGVEYEKFGKRHVVLARKEVIVSAGAIKSPHLLLLSGVGPKKHLQDKGIQVIHDLPGVGQNLHNHVSYKLIMEVKSGFPHHLLSNSSLLEFVNHRSGPMTSTGMSQVTGFIRTQYAEPPKDLPDVQLFFGGFQANYSNTGSSDESNEGRFCEFVPTLLRPQSRGHMELNSSDPYDNPKIYANYLTHDYDVKVLIEGIRFAQKLAETEPMKKLGVKLASKFVEGCGDYLFDSDDFWECAIRHDTGPENHQCGSCKMGSQHEINSVVDASLRVIGLKGLRVADASIMPRVTSGNINAPIVMIGEKCADMIKNTWLEC